VREHAGEGKGPAPHLACTAQMLNGKECRCCSIASGGDDLSRSILPQIAGGIEPGNLCLHALVDHHVPTRIQG
jgi:hypothetical protein